MGVWQGQAIYSTLGQGSCECLSCGTDEWRVPWHRRHVSSNMSLLFVPVCSGHTALCEAAVSNQDRSSPGTSEENICRICGYLTRGRKGCCHLLERSWEHNVLLQVCQVAFTTHTDLPPNVNPCKHIKVKGPRL